MTTAPVGLFYIVNTEKSQQNNNMNLQQIQRLNERKQAIDLAHADPLIFGDVNEQYEIVIPGATVNLDTMTFLHVLADFKKENEEVFNQYGAMKMAVIEDLVNGVCDDLAFQRYMDFITFQEQHQQILEDLKFIRLAIDCSFFSSNPSLQKFSIVFRNNYTVCRSKRPVPEVTIAITSFLCDPR